MSTAAKATPRPRQELSDQERCDDDSLAQEIVRLYHDDRLKLNEVAERLDLGYQQVRRLLQQAGRPPRTKADSKKLAAAQSSERISVSDLADPAYEARNHIADLIFCRLCGAGMKFALWGHLNSHHPTVSTKEYCLQFPGARLQSFKYVHKRISQQASKGLRKLRTLVGLMDKFAASHLTPAELKECRSDAEWEKEHALRDEVVCRVCGFKAKCGLSPHPKTHELNLHDYLSRFPGAPTVSIDRQEKNKNYGRDKLAELDRLQRKAWRPTDWDDAPADWRTLGGELLSREGHTPNEDLAAKFQTQFSRYGRTPKQIARSRGFELLVNRVRDWVHRQGRRGGKQGAPEVLVNSHGSSEL
jgi:hypothetical protein